jgi:hypothetical protein
MLVRAFQDNLSARCEHVCRALLSIEEQAHRGGRRSDTLSEC